MPHCLCSVVSPLPCPSPDLSPLSLQAKVGEPVRLALAQSGVEWVDDRVAFEDWPALKPSKNEHLGGLIFGRYRLLPTLLLLLFVGLVRSTKASGERVFVRTIYIYVFCLWRWARVFSTGRCWRSNEAWTYCKTRSYSVLWESCGHRSDRRRGTAAQTDGHDCTGPKHEPTTDEREGGGGGGGQR